MSLSDEVESLWMEEKDERWPVRRTGLQEGLYTRPRVSDRVWTKACIDGLVQGRTDLRKCWTVHWTQSSMIQEAPLESLRCGYLLECASYC